LDKQTILNAGVELAKTRGYRDVFKRNIATVLGCGMGTVNYHWGTMDELRFAILEKAIVDGVNVIIMQAVGLRDPQVFRENGQLIAAARRAVEART
jgi:AcrR family transcriptional regulator